MKKKGKLYYDENSDRYDIFFEDGSRYGGLHCGEAFEIKMRNDWKSTRIEYSHDRNCWYLVKFGNELDGLLVRM
jgi:hypothetical protein